MLFQSFPNLFVFDFNNKFLQDLNRDKKKREKKTLTQYLCPGGTLSVSLSYPCDIMRGPFLPFPSLPSYTLSDRHAVDFSIATAQYMELERYKKSLSHFLLHAHTNTRTQLSPSPGPIKKHTFISKPCCPS